MLPAILLLSCSHCAHDLAKNQLGEAPPELPEGVKSALILVDGPLFSQMPVLVEWPPRFVANSKITWDRRVDGINDHEAMLTSIPDAFLTHYRLGPTVETQDWIVTSIEPDNSQSPDALWILGLATRKGDSHIYCWGRW